MGTAIEAVVVGASAGAVQALRELFSRLRKDFKLPIIVVTHTAAHDVTTLLEVLQMVSAIPVVEAEERREPVAGTVHLAPTGYHLQIERSRRFSLSVDEKVCFARPSIDVLFESAAWAYGARLVGVVLTGANHDGSDGLKLIRERGGLAIVQDPSEAEAETMPRSAIDRAGADYVLPVAEIAGVLNALETVR